MVKTTKPVFRGLDKYSRSVWKPFLGIEFSTISNRRVLDLGCGECRYTKKLSDRNSVVRADKVSNSFVDVVCDAEELPFNSGVFDDVIAIGLMDYTDPIKTSNEIHRVLKSGGIARIMVPNILNPYVRVATSIGPYRNMKCGFGVEQISGILIKSGFEVINIISMGFCFWVPSKMLQEALIPFFNDVDWVTNGKYGNNIYLMVRKV